MQLVTPGYEYQVSVWARPAAGSASSGLMLTRELQGCGSTSFVWLASVADATDAAWVKLSGTLSIPSSCTPTKLVIYVESSSATLSYYVDDTSMQSQ
jgi:endo-1,4-beta-xylanase